MVVFLVIEVVLQVNYFDGFNFNGVCVVVVIYFFMVFYFCCIFECVGYVYGCEIWLIYFCSKGLVIFYFGFYVFLIWFIVLVVQVFVSIGWKYYMVFIVIIVVLVIFCYFFFEVF